MKTLKSIVLMAAFAFAVTLVGCTGKDGAPGATGPAGTSGANGTNGVANINSQTFMNQGLSYVSANSDYELTMNDAAITQTVVDNGEVVVYTQPSSNPSGWTVLPATLGGTSINITFAVGGVIVQSANATSGNLNFRVVVIPPSIIKNYPNTNWKDYSQVKAIMDAQGNHNGYVN